MTKGNSMKKIIGFLKNSVLLENPVLTLFAGVTPLLAVSTRLIDGAVLGLCAAFCITLSSLLFWALKKTVSEKLRDIRGKAFASGTMIVGPEGSYAEAYVHFVEYKASWSSYSISFDYNGKTALEPVIDFGSAGDEGGCFRLCCKALG